MSSGSDNKPSTGARRALRWLVAAPLLLVLLLGLLLWFLLGTSTGSGWLVGAGAKWLENRFPGARVEMGSPRALLDGIALQTLELPGNAGQANPQLLLRDLDLAIEIRCEQGILLCIRRLAIAELNLALAAGDKSIEQEKQGAAIELPRIAAPFAIKIFELAVGKLSVTGANTNPLLQHISLHGQNIVWQKTTLGIEQLQADQAQWHYMLAGEIQTDGDYPLALHHEARLEQQAFELLETPLVARIDSSNSLRELALQATLTGTGAVAVEARLQPLADGLPFEATVRSARLDPQAWIKVGERSDTIAVLHQLSASTSGTLAGSPGGKLAVIDASLQAEFESLTDSTTRLPLQLALTLTGGNQVSLKTLALGKPGNQLNASGALSLADGVAADFTLGFDNFSPGSLLRTAIDTLDGESRVKIDYPRDSFMQVDAALNALQVRAGKTSYLASGTVKNNAQQFILLDHLQLSTPGNRASLNGKLPPLQQSVFANRENFLAWLGDATLDADLQLDELGQLPIETLGRMNATIKLRPGKAIAVDALLQNLSADFAVAEQLRVNASIYPDLSPNKNSRVDIDGSGVVSNGISFDQLTVQASGNLATHQLILAGNSARHNISLGVEGSYASNAQRWRGSIDPNLIFSSQTPGKTESGNRIQIKSASPLKLSLDQKQNRFSIEAFCLSINSSELCSDGNAELGQNDIAGNNKRSAAVHGTATNGDTLAFRLSPFDLAMLDPIMPAELRWRGTLLGEGDVTLAGNGKPVVSLSISGEQGVLQAGRGEAVIEFNYDRIALQANANAEGLRARLELQRDNEPLLNAVLALGGSNFSALQGELQLNALLLGLFAPLAPALETLQGKLHAQLTLAGETSAPQIGGTLSLASGRVKVANNALELHDINLNGQFSGPALTLDGNFRAGEGRGSINGGINFDAPISGKLTLQGEQLRIISEPMIDLLANVNLNAQLQGNKLAVNGEAAIPEGTITIAELPASAQTLSSDVTFVDPDATKNKRTEQTLTISSDVALVLGPKLAFSGFDASAVLGGRLRVQQKAGGEPLGSGEIKILEGKYRGYGQRLDVRRGSLLFNGALSEPNINLEAVRKAEDAVVGIRVSGAASEPKIEPFSEPAMPDDQVIYRIITGRAPSTAPNANQNAIIAQTLISQGIKLGGSSLDDTAAKLGIENFNIGTGDGSDFQVSGYLDPALYLEYGVNALGDGSTFKLRWDFARRLSLEFIGGLASSLDLFYSRDF